MSNETSKQDYLKKYLEDPKDSARKRKKNKSKKTNASISRLKIVDENIDLKSINFGDKSEEEDLDDAPVIVEVIDDRPPEIKETESSMWRKIESVTHGNSPKSRKVFSYKSEDSDNSLQKHLSDSKRSARCSPPVVNRSVQNSKRTRHDSDNDISPPRVSNERTGHKKHDSGSDISPPRIPNERISHKRYDSDSDISPSRARKEKKSLERHDSDSDISPPRLKKDKVSYKKHNSDSDVSPPRNPKQSSSKKRKHSSDSDISPPRSINRNNNDRQDSNSGISPFHHKDNGILDRSNKESCSKISRTAEAFSRHSNHSPVRHKMQSNQFRESILQKNKWSSDSDISPQHSRASMERLLKDEKKKPKKTLSGLKAGLQSSDILRSENQELKKREKMHLNMLDDSVSGRNADTIIRDRKTGLKRDLDQEKQIKDEENKKEEKNQQKYREWGKGVEQTQTQKNKIIEDIYEMSKPLARYRDDSDLEEQLKSMIHDEDPMSNYIKKKKKKDTPSVPMYSGPPAPPNRFGILPGYRWDGVDRSNGFEKRYFEKINSTKAVQEEAYLWNVQNM